MGCCCSVDEGAIKREREATNPLDAQKDWISLLTADIGHDVFAVARDFPRMNVFDVDPDTQGGARHPDAIASTSANSRAVEATLSHHERFVRAIVAVAARCQEASSIGNRVEEWWREAQSLATDSASEYHALLNQPDSNPVMRKLQLDNALIASIQRSESAEPLDETVRYHAACKTFHVLEYLVQGVVFYPTQRLRYLLWFPWCSQLTDVEWNCYVYTRPRFPEHIYIVHRLLSRNYVDANHKQSTPTFEFEWDLVIALRQDNNCAFDDVRIEMRRVSITNSTSKVDASSLCDCGIQSDVHLREDRIAQLSQRVMDMFNVELEEK